MLRSAQLGRWKVHVLGKTYWEILDLSFGHEMVLEFVSGADFRCVLHHLTNLTHLKGSWGQVWPESCPKPANKNQIYI